MVLQSQARGNENLEGELVCVVGARASLRAEKPGRRSGLEAADGCRGGGRGGGE